MPAKSEAQRRLFQVARAIQKGKKVKGKGPARRIAKTVSAKNVRDFATKPTGKRRMAAAKRAAQIHARQRSR